MIRMLRPLLDRPFFYASFHKLIDTDSGEITKLKSNVARTSNSRARRNAIGCALLFAFCILLTRPVLEMGVHDDPSYIRTAIEFARTGHFVYNGWAAPILGWQIVWGALFIKLFGFSFTVMRLSTLPIAMATIYLLHQILVRFGLNSWNAVIGTLTIAITPLFLSLSTTFMTDIPGLFCILLCLYLCQRAVLATSDRAATIWLCAAALSNVIGGTVRQTAWLGVLVLVPCAAWLLRRRRGLLQTGILLWLTGAAAIFLCMHWFSQQPYSVPEKLIPSVRVQVVAFSATVVEMLLSVILFCLPVFVAFLPALRRVPLRILLWCGASATVLLAVSSNFFRHFRFLTFMTAPYLGPFVTDRGMFQLTETVGLHAIVLPFVVRLGLGILVILSGFSFLLFALKGSRRSVLDAPVDGSLSWHQLLTLVLPFTLAYCALLLPRAATLDAYDRYLLTACVSIVILALRFYQEKVRPRIPAISVVTLAVFAIWGILTTHDYFSMSRARLAVTEELRQAAVPRTLILAGFDYDFWSQLEAAGHLNNKKVRVPIDGYQPPGPSNIPFLPDLNWYTVYTPAIHPKYILVFSPMRDLKPTNFPTVSYRTWLPPYGGTIAVEQVPDGRPSPR